MVSHNAWEALLACGIHTAHHLLAQVSNRYTCGTALGIGCKVGTSSHVHYHLSGTNHLYTILSCQYVSATNGHYTHSSLIGNGLQLSIKVCIGQATCIRSIGNRTGIDIPARSEREQQMKFLLASSGISCHHHLIRVAHKICAVITGHVLVTAANHTTYTFLQVQATNIVLHISILTRKEYTAEILNIDTTEVLVLAITGTIALHIAGFTRPQGLLIELDFILVQTSEQASAQLTVSDRQRIFHPDVFHSCCCGRNIVPHGHGILGGKIIRTRRHCGQERHCQGTIS